MARVTDRVRAVGMAVVVAVLLAGGGGVHAQAPESSPAASPPPTTTTAAQDGFVPIDELPPEDRLPAAPFLVGAYTITLVLLVGYVWLLWRRLGVVQRDLDEVRRTVGAGGSRM